MSDDKPTIVVQADDLPSGTPIGDRCCVCDAVMPPDEPAILVRVRRFWVERLDALPAHATCLDGWGGGRLAAATVAVLLGTAWALDEEMAPVLARSLAQSMDAYADPRRFIARDEIGPYEVSTVFLPVTHPALCGAPQQFETLVFGPDGPGYCERYETVEQARAGHAVIVEAAKRGDDL